jgi:DNA-binding GntR family transcriptional regulator
MQGPLMTISEDVERPMPGTAPLYLRIRDGLSEAIAAGRLPKGALLLEGHVAGLFSSTRTPVRQAFTLLEEEGKIRRFDGRGYLVGQGRSAPKRVTLTPELLGLSAESQTLRKTPAWEAIYEQLERDIVHLSVFGRCRINEVELARVHGVGRQVARDALTRLEGLGVVEKDERMRWTIVPLDEARMRDHCDIRAALEPLALARAIPHAPTGEAGRMLARLHDALDRYPDLSIAAMDAMETDLHFTFIDHCPNREILIALRRARFMLNVSKHIMGISLAMPEREPFIAEHIAIFEAVVAGDAEQAAGEMRRHILVSLPKVLGRVAAFRDNHEPVRPAYVA